MSTIPNIKGAVERISKSVCNADDLARQWPLQRQVTSDMLNLPFVLNTTGLAQDIVAFLDRQQFVAAPLRWAVCSGGIRIEPSEANGYVGHVRGKLCSNHLGQNRETTESHFLLRGREGLTFSLADGDVFGYLIDANNQKFIVIFPSDGGGGALWAVTQDAPVTATPPTTVGVRLCDDAIGTNPHGPTFDVVLAGREETGVFMPSGSVVSILLTSDGTYEVESDYSATVFSVNGASDAPSPIVDFIDTPTVTWTKTGNGNRQEYRATAIGDGAPFWAATQSNWNNSTIPKVSCKLASSETDTNGSGDAFDVLLPRSNGSDPNVVEHKTILVQVATNGKYVCVSDYLDDAIGTIKFWGKNDTPPAGWKKVNGTDNADPGTEIDATFRMIKATDNFGLNGVTGGDDDTPDLSNGYASHNHESPYITPYSASGVSVDPDSPDFYAYSPGQVYTDPDGAPGTTYSGSNIRMFMTNVEPAYVYLGLIERVDNSV